MDETVKIALYARVSTKDGRQTTDNQVAELTAHAASRGWTVARQYLDYDSGAKDSRAQFQALMRDAVNPKRGWSMLLVWSLDRFSREGVRETFQHLKRLESADVRFVSLKEEYLDTSGMFRDVIISLLATLAKQERLRLQERAKAGQARAKSEGVVFGRKPVRVDLKAVKAMRAQGMSLREIGHALNVSYQTVKRRLAE